MTVVISIHDVHPTTLDASRRLVRLVERRGLRATLLVVAGPWNGRHFDDAATIAWLHDAESRGHEVSLHGWLHTGRRVGGHGAVGDATGPARTLRADLMRPDLMQLGSRVLARGCAEFVSLDAPEARRRLELGLATLERHGFHPVGFTPPGWLASRATIDEVSRLGFAYSTSHLAVHDLWNDRVLAIPAVSQRPGSPVSGFGAAATRRLGIRRIAHGLDLRIAVHPADLGDERLVHTIRCLLDAAACRTALTYAELVGAVPVPSAV